MVAVNYKASLMRRPTLRERIQGSRPLFFSSSLSLSFHLCVCVFERLEILWPCFNDLSKISHVSPIPIPSLLFSSSYTLFPLCFMPRAEASRADILPANCRPRPYKRVSSFRCATKTLIFLRGCVFAMPTSSCFFFA